MGNSTYPSSITFPALTAFRNPSCLHAMSPSNRSNLSSHTVPHPRSLEKYISKRPLPKEVPTSLRSPFPVWKAYVRIL